MGCGGERWGIKNRNMKSQNKRSIRTALTSKIQIEDDGIMSPESILNRLSSARTQTSKEANRLLMLSMASSAFFLVKIAGLRIDIVLADQRIFALPYGLFIFCIASQVLFVLSVLRSSESRVLDRMMRGICDKKWPETSELAYRTFPNEGVWFEIISHTVRKVEGVYSTKIFFGLASFIAIAVGLITFVTPLILGIYFLWNWTYFIQSGNIEIQYYSVMLSTIVCALWTISGISIISIDEDDPESIGA